MGLIHDDVLECENCGHHEFLKEERLSFHKKIRARELDYQKNTELQSIGRRITYVCANCKHELDK